MASQRVAQCGVDLGRGDSSSARLLATSAVADSMSSYVEQITDELCARVERGETIRAAAVAVGVSLSKAWRLIESRGKDVQRRRNRTVTANEHAKIIYLVLECGLSRRAAGRQLRRSVAVVHRHISSEIDAPDTLKEPIKCETCGAKIVVVPCLRCVMATSRLG